MLYIVTGVPGCGKSEFIDEIMINMAKNLSWKWAIASFENPPAHHIPKLMEKFTEKPFFKGQSQRISPHEMAASKEFLDDHFVFLEQKDGSMSSIEDIIARIKLSITRCGCRGAVIDPYNYIDMSHYESEHSGIGIMLSELSAFARANGVAIFFVAHPQKLYTRDDGSLPIPKGSHISGSAAWWAKADIGITVHRTDWHVEIHCWKARFKWLGQVGMRKLDYNVVNGKYMDHGKAVTKQWAEFDVDMDVKKPATDWSKLDF
jgi:twinkle protein